MDPSDISRRSFIKAGSIGAAAVSSVDAGRLMGQDATTDSSLAVKAEKLVASKLKPIITTNDKFVDVSRGDQKPHQLSIEQFTEAGLTGAPINRSKLHRFDLIIAQTTVTRESPSKIPPMVLSLAATQNTPSTF